MVFEGLPVVRVVVRQGRDVYRGGGGISPLRKVAKFSPGEILA